MSASAPLHQIRRRERAVDDETWIRDYLQQAQYGTMASEAEGQPFLHPVLFVYEPSTHALYFHTGRAGRIFANLTANPRVCFNTSQLLGYIAAPSACGFDVAYESVIVFGQAHLVEAAEEAERILRLLLEKYFPQLREDKDYTPMTPEQRARTAVWRVRVEAWSGKRHAMT